MGPFLIAFLLSAGGGAWVYGKVQRMTGGNAQTSLLMAGLTAVVAFVFTLIIFSFIPE